MTGNTQDVLINDRYDLVRVIGRGSTGTVYLAYDVQLDREVAIKVLNDKAADNQEVAARFEREIFITARLQHPGVVSVFERAQTPEGLPCCIMSLAFGQTLEDFLLAMAKAEDPWRESTLVDRLTLFLKILEVVSYAHSQGVVHRDLKPANIVLGEYGEVHVLDWGLARTLDEEGDSDRLEHFDDVFGQVGSAAVEDAERGALSEIKPLLDESGGRTGNATRTGSSARLQGSGSGAARSSTSQGRLQPATGGTPVPGSDSTSHEDLSAADTVVPGLDESVGRRGRGSEVPGVGMVNRRGHGSEVPGMGVSRRETTGKGSNYSRKHSSGEIPLPTTDMSGGTTSGQRRISSAIQEELTGDRRSITDRPGIGGGEGGTTTSGMRRSTGYGEDEYAPDDIERQTRGSTRARLPEKPSTDHEAATAAHGASRSSTASHSSAVGRSSGAYAVRSSTSSRQRAYSSGRYRNTGSYGSDSGRSTRMGDVLGSPVYMSPEQARGEANTADERADIYALGVILVELLTLHPPMEQGEDELLLQFIERIRNNEGWRSLKDLWAEAPRSLQQITDRALAYHPDDRYRHCEQYRDELSNVLDQLSASFSELERQRLEREREGAWLPVGRWNYLHQNDTEPFSETVTAYEGEPVGQVLHPEMGGLLIGGCGMQVYPLSINVTDDVRVTMEFSITGGSEFWIFMRGVPPTGAYAFRIGAWNGRWLSIVQTNENEDIFHPSALTMMPIARGMMNTTFISRDTILRRRLVIEVVGSTLRLLLDDEELSYQDPCPLLGPEHQQIGVSTVDSQLIIHELTVERRRSPLMVPTYGIANELLRQQLYPQAITYFQRFLREHGTSTEHRAEAHFMLCLAFESAGYIEQAEKELHRFIMDNMDHVLAQDAIYELAKLRVGDSSNIGPGVRVVLSYQETGDQSRARFCMWAVHVLTEAIQEDGITADIEESLQLLKHLIQGFSDESLLLETASYLLSLPMRQFAVKLFDLQAFEDLYRFQQRVKICSNLGYDISLPGLHTPSEYIDAARQLRSLDGDDALDRKLMQDILAQYRSVRDVICLSSYGCSQELLQLLATNDQRRPAWQLLEAGLLARNGHHEEARAKLEECFALMDKIESERTDIEIATISRLAMFALGYLPWDVAWEPIAVLNNNAELQAMAGWLAESFGHRDQAIDAYKLLHSSLGSGFRMVAEQGLARLQMQGDLG